MRRLEAFIWAFEPQLQSIHPPHRQWTYYAISLRASARKSCHYQDKYDWIPSGTTGALDIYDFEDILCLRDQVIDISGYLKNSHVSICGIASTVIDPSHAKKTVEWRQHKGTLDGEQVANWTSIAVGIMYFVRDAPVQYFIDIISIALFETWQKVDDGRDAEREEEDGPIFADGLFPIDKVLRLFLPD
ncbi:hypothetical protein ONS95_004932 [Cadophora gregata]|uniref:uncharacterized protein n=1 Tax=Cadophora gregata TaxID=51156 RepID=UPI0026DC95B5|nr:uncharacterized protein ONS95_004932 [Cadophora gregata]KAK0104657.1 hypothetical protein ONS95_004932 [Cadophora gregata]KAK0115259.1 hypothetical protein ONS96_013722 [Cadophora gregata f. sp. sojae]